MSACVDPAAMRAVYMLGAALIVQTIVLAVALSKYDALAQEVHELRETGDKRS